MPAVPSGPPANRRETADCPGVSADDINLSPPRSAGGKNPPHPLHYDGRAAKRPRGRDSSSRADNQRHPQRGGGGVPSSDRDRRSNLNWWTASALRPARNVRTPRGVARTSTDKPSPTAHHRVRDDGPYPDGHLRSLHQLCLTTTGIPRPPQPALRLARGGGGRQPVTHRWVMRAPGHTAEWCH